MILWIKALHVVFVTSWFAGLFYLPRIFVNLAGETHEAATARLLLMAGKLLRFTTMLAVVAIALGLWLWLGFGVGRAGPGNGWLYAKLFLVVLVIGYHHSCVILLRKFQRGENRRSGKWYRWFNEIPALLLLLIVILVIVKPF